MLHYQVDISTLHCYLTEVDRDIFLDNNSTAKDSSVSAGMWTVQELLDAGGPVQLELARVISPPTDLLYDPAFPAYHGLAWLDCAPLILPGATTLSAKIPVVAAAGNVHEAGQAKSPAITIPSLSAPNSKVPPR
jgi:hypothetical protein